MNIIEEREKPNLFFDIAADSIQGTRESQQDFAYFYTDEREVFAIICDGMGGMEEGGLASQTAISRITQDFKQMHPLTSPDDFFRKTAQRANQAVLSLRNGSGGRMDTGSTLIAVYIQENRMYWVSVGDSQIYHIREREIRPVNRRHNYRLSLAAQLNSGKIDQATYDAEEKTKIADALISFIGIEDLSLVDTGAAPVEILKDDLIVLCSDGIYKSLNDYRICAMARDNDIDMAVAAERMNAMALRYGGAGQDNTTVIILKCLNVPEPEEEAITCAV